MVPAYSTESFQKRSVSSWENAAGIMRYMLYRSSWVIAVMMVRGPPVGAFGHWWPYSQGARV